MFSLVARSFVGVAFRSAVGLHLVFVAFWRQAGGCGVSSQRRDMRNTSRTIENDSENSYSNGKDAYEYKYS